MAGGGGGAGEGAGSSIVIVVQEQGQGQGQWQWGVQGQGEVLVLEKVQAVTSSLCRGRGKCNRLIFFFLSNLQLDYILSCRM